MLMFMFIFFVYVLCFVFCILCLYFVFTLCIWGFCIHAWLHVCGAYVCFSCFMFMFVYIPLLQGQKKVLNNHGYMTGVGMCIYIRHHICRRLQHLREQLQIIGLQIISWLFFSFYIVFVVLFSVIVLYNFNFFLLLIVQKLAKNRFRLIYTFMFLPVVFFGSV